MTNDKKRHVIPGELIVSGSYRAEQNTVMEGDKILATVIGLSDVHDGSVRVIPLTGGYYPKDDDLVIGKIVSHSAMSWEVDINSCYAGMLPATDVFGRDFSSHSDDLTAKLGNGDLIVARIVNADKTRDPLLTISGRELGKIDSGELVNISPSKVARLIGKRGSMIQTIESGTHAQITIGQNGLVVVSCEDSDGLLKAIKAIELVEEKAHVANLTDQINDMLEIKSD
jgi:exosome complex component RRP4|tara:strand:- start:981 stop:1661 length:681 start_codon:yes stop_codon:yes gene_type:complete